MIERTALAAAMLLSACSNRGADDRKTVDIGNAASAARTDIANYSATAGASNTASAASP